MSDAYLVLKNSSIYKKIQCIEAHPLEEMNEEDWTELADTVEELIPNFIPMLKNKNILLDRKILASLAATQPDTFKAVVDAAK